MEHDSDSAALDEKAVRGISTEKQNSPARDQQPNEFELWNDDVTTMANFVGDIIPMTSIEDEWNLDLLHQRFGEASTTTSLFWDEMEKPSMQSIRKPATRFQDCCILDLDHDVVKEGNTSNAKHVLPKSNFNEEPSESLSWPFDSLFFSCGDTYSPRRWSCRKRRIEKQSTIETTKDSTDTLDSSTFSDSKHHPISKFHVWDQDPLDATSLHTCFDPSYPTQNATTPPPIRIRKRKKRWNNTGPGISESNNFDKNLSHSVPKIILPQNQDAIDPSSYQKKGATTKKFNLFSETSFCEDIDEDENSIEQSSTKLFVHESKPSPINPATAYFHQIFQQKVPLREADFQSKTNRSWLHRFIYEQTMGVTMAALKKDQMKR